MPSAGPRQGLDIFELLSERPGGLTRAEIVKALDRSPGEVCRMAVPKWRSIPTALGPW